MQRILSKRRSRKPASTWRVRAVQLALALAGTGLMTAIAVAAIGVGRAPASDGAMAAAIVAQQIAEGKPVTHQGASPPSGTATTGTPVAAPPSAEATPREAIIAEATGLMQQLSSTVMHMETMRTEAYKAKDMIRLNTVTTKLDDVKQIQIIANAAFAAIKEPGQDLFVMRAKLSQIRQGLDRARDAMAAAESAEGDSTNSVSSGIGPENVEADPSTGNVDPGSSGSPTSVFERPGFASPYR